VTTPPTTPDIKTLNEKRGYNNSKQFPHDLYKRGVQKQLLEHWLTTEPTVFVLGSSRYNFDAGHAGCEWGAFLRVRHPAAVILRVYPKVRAAMADNIVC
jgi:hypothetical protein